MELERISQFLTGIGFTITRSLITEYFLPGIQVEGMTIRIDPDWLVSPGDILHDAGHVAVVPALFRPNLKTDVEASLKPLADEYCATHAFMIDDNGSEDTVWRGLLQCGEAEAQAWAYAAAMAAGVPPETIFHSNSYGGDGETIIAMMGCGRHYGVHGLMAAKMTTRKFPTMIKWLQS